MKDNRDPQVLGEHLLLRRQETPFRDMSLSEVADRIGYDSLEVHRFSSTHSNSFSATAVSNGSGVGQQGNSS